MKKTILYFVSACILLILGSCGQQNGTMENFIGIDDSETLQPTPLPEEDNVEPSLLQDQDVLLTIYSFQQEDIAVIPEVQAYSYEDAVQKVRYGK